MISIHHGNNLDIMADMADQSFQLIYIDPPFNTGKTQKRTTLKTKRDADGDRKGYKGQKYKTIECGSKSYNDSFDDFKGFIYPRLEEAYRLLSDDGSLFFHIDYRESHYCKIWLDEIFGRDSFMNEIIWAYDYGARSKKKWSAKHDVIFWYAKNPKDYIFNFEEMDRIPYMAPGLVGPEKAARGKTPTDVWWHTIVSPNGKEKTGYPTQKPLGILQRIIKVHSNKEDNILDFFAGSGTTAEASAILGRNSTVIDENSEAIDVMKQRLSKYEFQIFEGYKC